MSQRNRSLQNAGWRQKLCGLRAAASISLGFALTLLVACSGSSKNGSDGLPLTALRDSARESRDGEEVASWLLSELLAPGGQTAQVETARKRLDELGVHGLLADLARGVDDDVHGRLQHASDHFLNAAKAARERPSEGADLLAHYAVERALALRGNTQQLWPRWHTWVSAAIAEPKALGWRARDELVQWWVEEAWSEARGDVEVHAVEKLGCLHNVRLAGPFGLGSRADALRSYDAETLPNWPERFASEEHWQRTPRVLKTERTGCTVEVDEPVADGVFYAETFFDVKQDTRAILMVKSALKVWVDGLLVFDRDLREWGSWTKVASGLDVPKGRHRVVARLMGGQTSVRLLAANGLPLTVLNPNAGGELSGIEPARLSFEPSPLRRYASPRGVKGPATPWLRFAAASLAHAEGEDEVAAVLVEPLVKERDGATGPALAAAASYVEGDPIFDLSQTEDMMRELHKQAIERDPELWVSALNVATQLAKSRGAKEAVPAFEQLAARYQQVPPLLGALASIYGELGWTPQYATTVKLRAERFPEDTEGLYAAAQVLTAEGNRAQADVLYEKIRELDPDSEVFVGLALERKQYDKALTELERLKARRPTRKDIQQTSDDVAIRSGKVLDAVPLFERRVEKNPRDGAAHLALADARLATGNTEALRSAIVDAAQAGADPSPVKEAIDLVEGSSELEPYRLNALTIIADYEKSGRQLPGTAARILDYMAAWVRADGSARLLEHEIIRLQSEEAIGRFAEHEVRSNTILQMRVIKKDGSILEPEPVQGKPTVTFPHLEIGDYIETEQIFATGGFPDGAVYDGPHWFFREQGVAYARSELVLISPLHQALDIETTGPVPTPQIEERGYFRVHRWRVDETPPAPTEPMSVPIAEYLPSVRISWGQSLPRRLRLLSSQVAETTPVDPRIVRIAENIVAPLPKERELDRAKRLYHWVLANVQDGEEDDGRRVVTGKRGNPWRAFTTLCRALDIRVDWAIAKNRLAPKPLGPDMEARQYNVTVLRLGDEKPTWLTFDGKFVPFGYLPAHVRGMPAYVLETAGPKAVTLPPSGVQDRVSFAVKAKLAPDGSAELRVSQRYEGALAASIRQAFDELPEARIHDVLEERLLASAFPGARLLGFELQSLNDPDAPLTVVMEGEMASFARHDGNKLVIMPPYAPRLSQLATLPERQTAILIAAERRQEISVEIQLPDGARAEVSGPAALDFQDFAVRSTSSLKQRLLTLERKIVIPATRIAPEAYPEFVEFTRGADALLMSDIVITL